jgi:hypothetical protein
MTYTSRTTMDMRFTVATVIMFWTTIVMGWTASTMITKVERLIRSGYWRSCSKCIICRGTCTYCCWFCCYCLLCRLGWYSWCLWRCCCWC